jgi:hypothetical protein
MLRSPILFLVFIKCVIFLAACTSSYRDLRKAEGDLRCIQQFRPRITSAYYETQVEAAGRQFSGILIMKKMVDSSLRIVFSSKPGIKFFDFEFLPDSGFRVLYIMNELNKKAVIKTLRKDFEVLLFMYTSPDRGWLLTNGSRNYYTFPRENGFNYYITDTNCSELLLMERGSKRKAVVDITMSNLSENMPDTIGIEHKNVNFIIGLKKIKPNAAE